MFVLYEWWYKQDLLCLVPFWDRTFFIGVVFIRKILKIPAFILLGIVTILGLISKSALGFLELTFIAMFLIIPVSYGLEAFTDLDISFTMLVEYAWIIGIIAIVLNVILLLLRGILNNLQKNLMMYVSDIKADNQNEKDYNDNITAGYLNEEFITFVNEKDEFDRLFEMGNISEQDYIKQINTLNEKYKK